MLTCLCFSAAADEINPFKLQRRDAKREKAEKLFVQAESDYRTGKYWECSRKLLTLVDYHPDFVRGDEAVFLLADCFYELKMTAAAAKLYKRLVQKYISSPLLAEALLGLQRIAFENHELQESLRYYQALMRGNPPQEIVNLAAYYAGMAYYKIDDYPRCVAALRTADPRSPYYDYILYTTALSLLRMKDVNGAVEVFNRLLELPVIGDERRRVIDEARLSLGYLYYELGYYQQAVREFDRLPAGSPLRPAALLAQSWALTEMNVWERAVAPLTELYTAFPEHESTQEALFLLGRCYLKLQRYPEAMQVYDRLIEMFPEASQAITSVAQVNANIEREKGRIEKRQMELLVLESKLVDDLRAAGDAPPDDLNQRQRDMLAKITAERGELSARLEQLNQLAAGTAVKEQRRNWRAYAEYGRSRAAFLLRQQERRENRGLSTP